MTNRHSTHDRQHTWIIGASSGIGAALAKSLAQRGEVVALSSRNTNALNQLREQMTGQQHKVLALDVRDPAELAAAFDTLVQDWPRIDRIVYMAGIYEPMRLDALDVLQVEEIMGVNLLGAFNLISVALPNLLEAGGRPQLAFCASVAGYRGLPNAQPYGASKAGLINLVESLKVEQGERLDVRLISPGFVATRLTEKNSFDMPFRLTPAQAGERIAKGLQGSGFELHFPRRFTWMMKALACLPYRLYWPLARRAR